MSRLRDENEFPVPSCPIYPDRPRARWVNYAAAIALVGVVHGLLMLAVPHFPAQLFRVPYVLTIAAIGYLFGIGPTIVALLLVLSNYLRMQLSPDFAGWPLVLTPTEWADFATLAFGAVAAGIAMVLLRENRRGMQMMANDLAEREAILDAFFSQSPVSLALLDTNLRLRKANSYTARLLGRPAEKIEGRLMSELVPDFETRMARQLRRVIEAGETETDVMVSSELPEEPGVLRQWLFSHFPISMEGRGTVGIGMIGVDITDQVRAVDALIEEQKHKLEFYRRTIMAATAGKLIITEPEAIEALDGTTWKSWKIADPGDIQEARHEARGIALEMGLDETRAVEFATAVGEAATNAVKHAGGGLASLLRRDNSVLFVISDHGPGIEALSLPSVALERGYTTAGTLGMGFKLMMELTNRVHLATGPEGTTVALETGPYQRVDTLLSPFVDTAVMEE